MFPVFLTVVPFERHVTAGSYGCISFLTMIVWSYDHRPLRKQAEVQESLAHLGAAREWTRICGYLARRLHTPISFNAWLDDLDPTFLPPVVRRTLKTVRQWNASRTVPQWCRFLGRRLDVGAAGLWPTSEKRPGTKSREVWHVAEAGAMGICRWLCGTRLPARRAAGTRSGSGHEIALPLIAGQPLRRQSMA